MGLLSASLLLGSLVLALPAGSLANTAFIFNFENDLEGWIPTNDYWRWADKSGLHGTIMPAFDKGIAVMDKRSKSDQLSTPFITAPQGGNFTMKFYVRSRYAMSNTFDVYTRNRYNIVRKFLDLRHYSMPTTSGWTTVQKELEARGEDIKVSLSQLKSLTFLPE